MKKYIIILLTLGSFSKSIAQTKDNNGGSIKGKIVSENGDESIPFASIRLNGAKSGTNADENGYFVIKNLADSTYSIDISHIGYSTFHLDNLVIKNAQPLDIGDIKLKSKSISLKEVVISPGSYSIMEKIKSGTQIALSEKDIKNMAWAEDVNRAVSRLPGISANDYSSRFAIRGGEANQVMISLDGMELYEPFHQRDLGGGIFSIVDVEAVRCIDLLTGGFSAENGNRLSGVFGMKTKTQQNDKKNYSAALSITTARIFTDGKFAKNKGSYLFSARRGMLGETLKATGNKEFFPHYYDGFSKIEYRLNDKHTLSLHFLHSGDKTFINSSPEGKVFEQYNTKYNSTYSWMTLKSYYTPKLYSKTILFYSNLSHSRIGSQDKYEDTDKGTFVLNDRRKYSTLGIKQDWNWEALEKVHFKWGFEAKELKANYDYVNSIHELRVDSMEQLYYFDHNLDIRMKPSGEQIGTYLTSRFKILPKLIAEVGARFDYTSYTGDKNWSPRASMVFAFTKNTFLRAGWGYYYQTQFINDINANNGETKFHSAELAKHYVLGFEHLFKNGISLRAEAYYKELSNLVPIYTNLRDHLESIPEARNDLAKIFFNGSTSKGVELFLRYDQGKKISWWFSYALADARDDINHIEFNGLLIKRTGKVPRLNNQRHTIYADINYRPTKTWHFSASWQFYQGWPRTNYTYRYTYLPNGDVHFYQAHSEYNGTEYPAYHRLDIRVNKSFKLKKAGEFTIFLDLVNVYNQKNLKKFDLDSRNPDNQISIDSNGNYVPTGDNKYWLGFLPVFGIKWEINNK